MNLVSTIDELDYYNAYDQAFCYCEHITQPNDLMLQDRLGSLLAQNLSFKVFLMSPDGLTEYEESTSYFDFTAFYFGGYLMYNLKLTAYSEMMCSLACWILRVEVYSNSNTIYRKWTNKYCQVDCCITPSGIEPIPINCDVFVNNIQKIYHYNPNTDIATLIYSGVVNYSDLATIGDKLYARDGFTGNIDEFQWTGSSLNFLNTRTGLPTGAALGSDATYLYLDDGLTIKRLDLSNSSLTTVVASLGTSVQGDILINNSNQIIVSQDNGSGGTKIVFYTAGVASDTIDPIVDNLGNPINDLYGMYFSGSDLYIMTNTGKIYLFDLVNEEGILESSTLNSINTNGQWNGAAQNYGCESSEGSQAILSNDYLIESIPYGNCGTPLIRIEAEFDCLDYQTGEYYGLPVNIAYGNAFAFKKVVNITATITRLSREISRQIAFNCKVQRSESAKQYRIESVGENGVFPVWKFDELEGMFHAPKITISDFRETKEYSFPGGTISPGPIYGCWQLYRLNFTLESCIVRQTFGCNDDCGGLNTKTFLIPESYKGGDFFSESKTLIGDQDALLTYYSGFGNVTLQEYENTSFAFTVTANGYIPTSFYFDSTTSYNRVYGTNTPIAPQVGCNKPVLGTAQVYDMVCETPVLDTAQVYDDLSEVGTIIPLYEWEFDGTEEVVIFDTYVRVSFHAENSTLIESDGAVNMPIARISANAAPATTQTITSDMNPTIPSGGTITIDNTGFVTYTGTDFTSNDPATLEITDLYYLR